MTNGWLVGLCAASLLLAVACEGEGAEGAEAEAPRDDEALTADFATAENRAHPDGGVAAAGGRGDDCKSGWRGQGGQGGRGAAHHDGGAARADRDVDQDEAADEAADPQKRGAGRTHDGGVRAQRGQGRCGAGPRGGQGRDGGPGHARDGGGAVDPGRGPRRDAGSSQGGEAARTVTLADGTTVRLDPACPSLDRGGVELPGCCLPANTCGLSTHLIDVTGVPKGCQGYAAARQIDPSFPLSDKACTFRNRAQPRPLDSRVLPCW